MKKILYATTAIAAVSAISAANAQESAMMSAAGNDLSIGGYYEFGYASRSDDRAGDDNGADSFTYGDSELYIDFETTSDAGLTYGVQLDFEVVSGNRHVESGPAKNAEESSIYVSGNFGTIHLGHDDYASTSYNIWAPTHEGSLGQDNSIHGLRYGEGAGLRVIGLSTADATATAQARADFEAGGELVDPDDEDGDRQNYVSLSGLTGVTSRTAVETALRTQILGDLTGADLTAATPGATASATAIANAVLTDVDHDDDNATAEITVLRGLQQDVNLAHTASLTQSDDNAKISYHSPNFGGLSFGASFADSDSSENSPTAFGASFTGSVDKIPFVGGGFSYKLAGWQLGNGADGDNETSTTHFGVNIGIGDLTLTAAQLSGDIDEESEDEVKTTEFGIGYAVHDSLSVGFSTADANNNDTDAEGTFQSVSVEYTIAPGLKTTAAYNQYEVERNEHLIANNGSELVWQVEFAF